MDERAVRAAVERITSEALGLFVRNGVECRAVPVTAIDELVDAVAIEETDPATDRPFVK